MATGPLLHEENRPPEVETHDDGDGQHDRRQQRGGDRCNQHVETRFIQDASSLRRFPRTMGAKQ